MLGVRRHHGRLNVISDEKCTGGREKIAGRAACPKFMPEIRVALLAVSMHPLDSCSRIPDQLTEASPVAMSYEATTPSDCL